MAEGDALSDNVSMTTIKAIRIEVIGAFVISNHCEYFRICFCIFSSILLFCIESSCSNLEVWTRSNKI